MKIAIVHIGAHKTGSTSIQMALVKSKDDLRTHGIRYFNDYDRRVQLLSLGLRAAPKKPPIKSTYTSAAEALDASRRTWMSLARTVRREELPVTVISEEAMMRIERPDRLARVLHRIFDHVFIVAYVRNPVTRYPSSIDQWIREGRSTKGCTKGRNLVPPLMEKLRRYEDAFGQRYMIVRNFDPENWHGGTPSKDFAHVVSQIADRPIALNDAGHKNFSFPASVSHALLQQNDALEAAGLEVTKTWHKSRKALINEIRQLDGVLAGEKLNVAGTPLLGHLSYTFREEVDFINDRYLRDQTKMVLPDGGAPLPRSEIRASFSEWINGYRDDAVIDLVAKLKGLVERPRIITHFLP